MPSPITHAMMGYVVYQLGRTRFPQNDSTKVGPLPRLLVATAGLSLLPDLDALPGILMGNLERFHNNMTHSLVFGLIVALVVGSVVWLKQHSGFLPWFVIGLVCYELHVFMDFITVGRGVMLVWPFSLDRYEPPIKLFYGVHWSDGWISVHHAWTLISESALIFIVALITRIFSESRRRRSTT